MSPGSRSAADELTLRAGRRRPVDAVSVLSVFVVLMLALPSLARISAAGTIGAPAVLLSMLMFLWWLWAVAHRSDPGDSKPQWVRRAGLMLFVIVLASYGYASYRPLPGDEVLPALSSLLTLVGSLGVTFVAADGVADRSRLDTLVRRMVVVGACVGALAIVQFLTHQQYVDRLVLPGLSLDSAALEQRGSFSRPSGTSAHALEFGAVMAMIAPLAVLRARYATSHRIWHWAGAALPLVGALLSLSRSAIVCCGVGLVVIAARWPWRQRLAGLGLVLTALVGLGAVLPGFIGTLRLLFGNLGNDSSVQSRTDAYAYVAQNVERFPWLGKGPGTFLPKYWILDNGYLNFLVSNGVLGLAALLLFVVAGLRSARRATTIATNEKDRDTGQAFFASALAGGGSILFFDFFGFTQAQGTFFLVVGLCAAVLRVRRTEQAAITEMRERAETPSTPATRR